MTVEEVIISHRQTAIAASVRDVAQALVGSTVLLPTDEPVVTGTVTSDGKTPLAIAGGADKHGRMWAYAYTSREEFRRAFPAGRASAGLHIEHFVPIIIRDQRFAGIFFNGGSEAAYVMPREFLAAVQQVVARRADG